MRKYLLSLFFVVGFWFGGRAQWVSIPDTAFGTFLNTHGYSQCLQGNNALGWQMDTTCNKIVTDTAAFWNIAYGVTNLNGVQYFDSLRVLQCCFSTLINIPFLPANLKELYCQNSHLSALPVLPITLTHLYCHENFLDSLPSLPNSLKELFCYNNNLTHLPFLPNSITVLLCGRNPLTHLPILPNSLISLDCSVAGLTSLPALPDSLIYLNCIGNNLISLPALPPALARLYCFNNLLTTLPILPPSLTVLDCNNNQLTSLPALPDTLSVLYCSNNPNLHCLPELKKITIFQFLNTGITCLPNYPQSNDTSSPALDSYPLCDTSSFNIYGCGVYWNIAGKVYADTSMNCLYNAGENTFSNLKVKLYASGVLEQLNYSVTGGGYFFDTDLSTYQYSIDTSGLPFSVACPDTSYYTSEITVSDSFDNDMNFGLRCKSGFDLVAQSISAVSFRPANIAQTNISAGDATNFYGAYCATGISGAVQLVMSGPVTYVSPANSALLPSNVSGDTVTWNIPDFGVVNFFTDFNINVATDTNAVLGSQICFTLIVNPIAGDNNSTNNILTHCFTVVSSYDPNEKEVYPTGNIDTAQKWLTYTIHFQNTGTAEAQHIYVTDTLDSDVDVGSFQLLAYSHQPMVQIKENAVRFNFPNINLPDSNTNEPLSHGYVQYKVKLKENLPVGTSISNTAFIYFDFNAPVVTNTTTNTIALATGIADNGRQTTDNGEIHLQPNPARESVTVSVDESMIGSKLVITDITGRRILMSNIEHRISNVEVKELVSGVYFIAVENEKGRVTGKLVKM